MLLFAGFGCSEPEEPIQDTESEHLVSTQVEEPGGGTIEPPQATVVHGEVAQFEVTPHEDHTIAEVYGCGGTLDGDIYTTGPVTGPCTVTARFDQGILIRISAFVNNEDWGKIEPSGDFHLPEGSSITFTITPNAGYKLKELWVDGEKIRPRLTYTLEDITEEHYIVAVFEEEFYTLQYQAGEGGEVTGELTQTVGYGEDGTQVEAVPHEGHHFVDWSDQSTANPRIDKDVVSDLTVTANFERYTYQVTYLAGEGGSIEGNREQTVPHGKDGEVVTAIPDGGYHFVDWSDGLATPSRRETNVVDNIELSASFALNTYTLNYLVQPGGTLAGEAVQEVAHGASGSQVLAVPDEGYGFTGWSDGRLDNPRTDEGVVAGLTVTALFEINSYTVSAQVGGDGTGGQVNPDQVVVTHGQTASFIITPEPGYVIDDQALTWDGCFGNLGQNPGQNPAPVQLETSPVTGDCTITVLFKVAAYPVGGGLRGLSANRTLTVMLNETHLLELTHEDVGKEYRFDQLIPHGETYKVEVVAQPTQHQCAVFNDFGMNMNTPVLHVDVECTPYPVAVAGAFYTMAIKADGTLWGWGRNNTGQLGLGDKEDRDRPVQVVIGDGDGDGNGAGDGSGNGEGQVLWKQVAVTRNIWGEQAHTVAIREDGTMWSWGWNWNGRLGQGTSDIGSHPTPRQVGTWDDWETVAVGEGHNLAIRSDGTLWGWGFNAYGGLLGVGIEDLEVLEPTQVLADGDAGWVKVAAGVNHSLGIRTDGTLWAWGANGRGQLGLGNLDSYTSPQQVGTGTDWVAITAGSSFSAGVRADGTLWSWGDASDGRLGLGAEVVDDQLVPRQVAVDFDDHFTWSDVTATLTTAIATDAYGQLWGWGNTENGQLGTKDADFYYEPVSVWTSRELAGLTWRGVSLGAHHGVGVIWEGKLKGWGENTRGQLGLGDVDQMLNPTQVGTDMDWQRLSTGFDHSLAIKEDGTLWGWGLNDCGQLALDEEVPGREVPEMLGERDDWVDVAAGNGHSLGITGSADLWGWGRNDWHQLGLGHNHERMGPELISASVGGMGWVQPLGGYWNSAGLKSDGTLWSWGYDNYGELGHEEGHPFTVPIQVYGQFWRQVSMYYHTLAIGIDGSLWAWGHNMSGQLGVGTSGPHNNTATPAQVGDQVDWEQVSVGMGFSLGLRADGTLWAWGSNQYGQLGVGESDGIYKEPVQVGSDDDWILIEAGWYHGVALKEDGTMWAWGNNTRGQVGVPEFTQALSPVQLDFNDACSCTVSCLGWETISAGPFHTLAIRCDGSLWAWGNNQGGQLGISTERYPEATPIPGWEGRP